MLQRQYGFKRTYNVSRYVPRMTCYISNICHAIEGLESFMAVSKLGCKAESEPNCMFSQATITIGTMKSSKYYSLAFLAANRLTPRLLSKQRQMSIHIPLLLPSVSTRKPPPFLPGRNPTTVSKFKSLSVPLVMKFALCGISFINAGLASSWKIPSWRTLPAKIPPKANHGITYIYSKPYQSRVCVIQVCCTRTVPAPRWRSRHHRCRASQHRGHSR